jgi:hypothetical protein
LAQEFKVAMKEHNKKKKNKSKDFDTQHKVVARQKRKTMGRAELKKFMVSEKEKFSSEIATEEQDFEAKLLSQQEKRRKEVQRKHNQETDELRKKHAEQDEVLKQNQTGEKRKLETEMGISIRDLKVGQTPLCFRGCSLVCACMHVCVCVCMYMHVCMCTCMCFVCYETMVLRKWVPAL